MKSSLDRPNATPSSRKIAAFLSASAATGMPALSAVCFIFRPCSSVPVRKNTSRPSSRSNRAIASVAMAS
jgi:hypothetical protein